jgi:hypothetical protein
MALSKQTKRNFKKGGNRQEKAFGHKNLLFLPSTQIIFTAHPQQQLE